VVRGNLILFFYLRWNSPNILDYDFQVRSEKRKDFPQGESINSPDRVTMGLFILMPFPGEFQDQGLLFGAADFTVRPGQDHF